MAALGARPVASASALGPSIARAASRSAAVVAAFRDALGDVPASSCGPRKDHIDLRVASRTISSAPASPRPHRRGRHPSRAASPSGSSATAALSFLV